ncbi:MAG TPA: hypothetical protein VJ044_07500 [Candidatus Hodarchaeales archaeon]|nr:hypothetical protein [Candidatus Hodarchaeales archaeon]
MRESAINDLLLAIGTTLKTTLPYQIVIRAINRRIPIFEVNIEPSENRMSGIVQTAEKSAVPLPKVAEVLRKNYGVSKELKERQ